MGALADSAGGTWRLLPKHVRALMAKPPEGMTGTRRSAARVRRSKTSDHSALIRLSGQGRLTVPTGAEAEAIISFQFANGVSCQFKLAVR